MSKTEATTFLPYSQNGKQARKHILALTHTWTNTKSVVFLFWKLRSVQKLVRQIYTLVMNSCHMAPPPSTSGPAFLYHQCVCTTDSSPIFTCSEGSWKLSLQEDHCVIFCHPPVLVTNQFRVNLWAKSGTEAESLFQGTPTTSGSGTPEKTKLSFRLQCGLLCFDWP